MILAVLAGLVVGSFLNVCADRVPYGQSVVSPGSHCPACGRRLRPWELAPVLSFLWLRGKCSRCAAPIPARTLALELLTGASFGLIWVVVGWGPRLILASAYAAVLLLIAVIDIEHQRIPNVIVLPAAGLAPFAAAAAGAPLPMSLLGAAVGAVLLGVPYVLRPGGLGAGDLKLAGLVGAICGYPLVLVALWLAVVTGGTVGVALLIVRDPRSALRDPRSALRSPMPFGPFLAGGGLATLLFGQPMLDWYLTFL